MPHTHSLLRSLIALLLPACATASGTVMPFGTDHPAHADASESPLEDPAAFLRIDSAEIEPAMAPGEPEKAEGSETPAGAYVCPMHPEVSSNEPGRCPECGMNLVPREKSEEHPHD